MKEEEMKESTFLSIQRLHRKEDIRYTPFHSLSLDWNQKSIYSISVEKEEEKEKTNFKSHCFITFGMFVT